MQELNNAKSISAKIILFLFIWLLYLFRFESYFLFYHMNRRGVLTNYWVINDDDEIHSILDSV